MSEINAEVTQPEVITQTLEEAPAATQGTQSAAIQTETPKIKYKYDKKEYEIGIDEAKDYVEAGRYYLEQGKSKLQEYQNHPGLKFMEDAAKESGISVEELANIWRAQREQEKAQRLAEEKGLPPEVALEVIKTKDEKFQLEQKLKAYENDVAKKQRMDKEYADFFANRKDISMKDIPDEVLIKWDQGVNLEYAYATYENKMLREKVLAMETNKSNADTSMGAAQGKGATSEGELTQEEFDANKNNPKWVDKHYETRIRPAMISGKIKVY
jgi:hypothetical protein